MQSKFLKAAKALRRRQHDKTFAPIPVSSSLASLGHCRWKLEDMLRCFTTLDADCRCRIWRRLWWPKQFTLVGHWAIEYTIATLVHLINLKILKSFPLLNQDDSHWAQISKGTGLAVMGTEMNLVYNNNTNLLATCRRLHSDLGRCLSAALGIFACTRLYGLGICWVGLHACTSHCAHLQRSLSWTFGFKLSAQAWRALGITLQWTGWASTMKKGIRRIWWPHSRPSMKRRRKWLGRHHRQHVLKEWFWAQWIKLSASCIECTWIQ